MINLSALLIVKNEAPIVATALNSVRDFDEIIVVDTGSTDDTISICSEFTDRIFHFDWIDDFSAARNRAIELARGDWCYSIDADHELLTPVELVRQDAQAAEDAGHLGALVKTDLGGGHEAWREVLFKRDPRIRWQGAVHEVLVPASSWRAKHTTRRCDYSDNHKLDPERNLRILTKMPDSPRRTFYLAREQFDHGNWDKSASLMRKYLETPTWLPEIVEAHLTLAKCYWQMMQGNLARASALEALRNNPSCGEAMRLLAKYHNEPWKSQWTGLAKHAANNDILFTRN